MPRQLDTRLDREERRQTAGAEAQDRVLGDAFVAKIQAMARDFAGVPPPDFANASFAELFAWSLAQPPAE